MKKCIYLILVLSLCLAGCNIKEESDLDGNVANNFEELSDDDTIVAEGEVIKWEKIKNGEEKEFVINGENVILKFNARDVEVSTEKYNCTGKATITNVATNNNIEFEFSNIISAIYDEDEKFDGNLKMENLTLYISKFKDVSNEKEYFIINNDNQYRARTLIFDEEVNLIVELEANTYEYTTIHAEREIDEVFAYTINLYDNQIIYYDSHGDIVKTYGDDVKYYKEDYKKGDLLLERRITIDGGNIKDKVINTYDDYSIGLD